MGKTSRVGRSIRTHYISIPRRALDSVGVQNPERRGPLKVTYLYKMTAKWEISYLSLVSVTESPLLGELVAGTTLLGDVHNEKIVLAYTCNPKYCTQHPIGLSIESTTFSQQYFKVLGC